MKTCLDQHSVCNANCCRMVRIPKNNIKARGRMWHIAVEPLTPDMTWYFRIRGFMASEGGNVIRALHGRHKVIDDGDHFIIFMRDCELLDGFSCRGHPAEKPDICKALDWDMKGREDIYLTEGCMYKEE